MLMFGIWKSFFACWNVCICSVCKLENVSQNHICLGIRKFSDPEPGTVFGLHLDDNTNLLFIVFMGTRLHTRDNVHSCVYGKTIVTMRKNGKRGALIWDGLFVPNGSV